MNPCDHFTDFDTMDEVLSAVRAGQPVRWQSDNYQVLATGPSVDDLIVNCDDGHSGGLYWLDETTTEYEADQFYLVKEKTS